MQWRRMLQVLPPPDQPEKREKAIKIIAESFFKLLIRAGFQFKEVMQFINCLMDALTKHSHKESGGVEDSGNDSDVG